jgi:transcriptional regulator with XRE-family HTH domain
MKIYANDNFKVVRMMNGFSIVDLADKVGVSKQMLGQVERRINGISPAKAKSIIEALGVEFKEVFEFVERGEK